MKQTPKFCVHCGNPINSNDLFCAVCGAQLVRNLQHVPQATPINTEVKEEEPINTTSNQVIEEKSTNVAVSEVNVNEVGDTNIASTEAQTNQEQMSFVDKVKHLFMYPNPLIFGIAGFVSAIVFMILVNANGFAWWIIFFLLIVLGCIFEIVLSILQCPAKDGSNNFFKRFPTWLGIGQEKKVMVKKIISGAVCVTAVMTFLGFFSSSLIVGFKNFIVVDNCTYEIKAEDAARTNPMLAFYTIEEGGYDQISFLPGGRYKYISHWSCSYGNQHYVNIMEFSGTYTRSAQLITLDNASAYESAVISGLGITLAGAEVGMRTVSIDSLTTVKVGVGTLNKI